MINHVSVGATDLGVSGAFYDAVLGTLGCARLVDHKSQVAWGRDYPAFWIAEPSDGGHASAGNGTHICFNAPSRAAVGAFHAAALAHGGEDAGSPGLRPHYEPDYYAAFALDPAGNKIEAVHLG